MLSNYSKAFNSKDFSNHSFLSGTPFGTPLLRVLALTNSKQAIGGEICIRAYT